jgi:uncharacterized protein YecE (DUF72 family)
MIQVGTSGFSYPDWVGPFYPPGTRPQAMLPWYARHFDALEINFTYYRLPAPGQLAAMSDRCADRVTFAVKAWQGMTHADQASAADLDGFVAALQPLAERGVLGAVLLQFPGAFRPSAAATRRLLCLAARLRRFPVVAEFRHRSWVSEATFRLLRAEGIGFCCVDEPRLPGLLPPVAVATAAVAYVRFHGRNAEHWFDHEQPHERYDYRYGVDELAEWVPRLRQLDAAASRTLVFMNNHFRAKAVDNATQLKELLRDGR